MFRRQKKKVILEAIRFEYQAGIEPIGALKER
jgi:hypothetical protein